jgi:hypothetical protein
MTKYRFTELMKELGLEDDDRIEHLWDTRPDDIFERSDEEIEALLRGIVEEVLNEGTLLKLPPERSN